ncbi:hypothetical protein EDC27_0412 [Desulfosoma caldarium]|uniref:Uncharacterized protein n=1 Tax=Desulfosoma caldarium TaxID=610254 RepID=A0A3N1VK14_9BACT|nr:hypothetical protein EDC27_0412 [Desulfosoma caldarium]
MHGDDAVFVGDFTGPLRQIFDAIMDLAGFVIFERCDNGPGRTVALRAQSRLSRPGAKAERVTSRWA